MNRYLSGNQITLLRNGAEYFPAIEAAIDAARLEIHLQAYIYEQDDTGIRIGEALKRAVSRGVLVCVLLDGYGSKNLSPDYVEVLRAAGIKLMFFRPKISPWTLKRNRLRRLHRKVVVVDGEVAFVGGINIIDDDNCPGNNAPRVDYAVKVEGPLVRRIHTSIYRHWRRISWMHFRQAHDSPVAKLPAPVTAGSMRAAYVIRNNVLHRRDIEKAYLRAIGTARREIVIANAYFLPGKAFRRALIAASKRGVRVRVLLQGKMEYWLMFATHAVYGLFLRHNIEIYEYRKSFMHSKVAVVDDLWATVGSSNIDPMSLLLAHEANIVVRNREFATALRQDIEQAIEIGGYRIRTEDWNGWHVFRRFFSWATYLLVRIMMGIAGFPKGR
ncbi:MAG TPA: cardiolipin synthase ClsB [Methylophilaceae bacterium]|nr:cardiolipin synthase ClsB [Methylophilaceae bacterium]